MYDAGLVVAITLKITSNGRSKNGKVIVKSARSGIRRSAGNPRPYKPPMAPTAAAASPWRFGTKVLDFGGALSGREYLMRRVFRPLHPTAAPAGKPHETGQAFYTADVSAATAAGAACIE